MRHARFGEKECCPCPEAHKYGHNKLECGAVYDKPRIIFVCAELPQSHQYILTLTCALIAQPMWQAHAAAAVTSFNMLCSLQACHAKR